MEYQVVLEEIALEVKGMADPGRVPAYIPELSRVDPGKLGVFLAPLDGDDCGFGDCNERFSVQSIAKVLALGLAFDLEGEALWKRVGVEPSGSPFNSLVQLEYEGGIPRNPLINAGALVLCDILVSRLGRPEQAFLEYVRSISGCQDIDTNPAVAESESGAGFRNTALVNLMKAYGNIHNPVEAVLDLYFSLCAVEMSCRELTAAFGFLAADGVSPATGDRVISLGRSKRINAIMQLCGFYDEAGEFAYRVGLPGKSGVGGGIVAVSPGEYCIATWSPRLNPKGNSCKGMKILEAFTTQTRSSIF